MTHISLCRLLTALSLGLVGCFVSAGILAANRRTSSAEVDLARLIPREKWEDAGLNKLTAPEQQALAGEINALLGSSPSAQSADYGTQDRTQWRKLHRRISKDEAEISSANPCAFRFPATAKLGATLAVAASPSIARAASIIGSNHSHA